MTARSLYTERELRSMPTDDLLRRLTLIYNRPTKAALEAEAKRRGLL
jgi:hypothetical protein